MLSAQSRPGRDHSSVGDTLRSPIVKSLITLVVLAVVVVGGWVAYTSQNQPALGPQVPPPGPTPIPSATQLTAASPLPSTPAVSGTPAPTQPAPSAAVARPAITPIPPTPPKATPAPKTTPVPTVAAVAPSKPTAAGRPVGGAYEALKAGRLAEATAGFESVAQARSGEFSVQLLVACSASTIEKAIQNDPSTELFVLPASIGGKSCHRLMRGFYKSMGEATQAVSALPGYYVAEGAKPKAVPVKSVVR